MRIKHITHINIRVMAALALFLSFTAFAQAKPETLKIGDYVIEYDQKIQADTDADGKDDRQSYYLKDQLVFVAYDENGDGKPNLWFRYTNGDTVDLELADKNTDGKPDTITEIDSNGKAEVIFDTGGSHGGSSLSSLYVLIVIPLLGAAAYVRNRFFKKN